MAKKWRKIFDFWSNLKLIIIENYWNSIISTVKMWLLVQKLQMPISQLVPWVRALQFSYKNKFIDSCSRECLTSIYLPPPLFLPVYNLFIVISNPSLYFRLCLITFWKNVLDSSVFQIILSIHKVCVFELVLLEDNIGYIKSSHTDLLSYKWQDPRHRLYNSFFCLLKFLSVKKAFTVACFLTLEPLLKMAALTHQRGQFWTPSPSVLV